MSKIKVTMLSVALFVAGVAFGGYFATKLTTDTLVAMQTANLGGKLIAEVKTRVTVLRFLRNSNQEAAIELLENLLDGDLMEFGSLDPKYRPDAAAGTLRVAAEYRSKYPHRIENAVVDGYVKRALAIPFETGETAR